MKNSKPLWIFVALFIIVLSLWLYSGFNYPYAVYEYHQTGEVAEWFDIAAGLEVDAIPVLVPDNPLWVDIIRKIAPLALVILFMVILYIIVRERGKATPSFSGS